MARKPTAAKPPVVPPAKTRFHALLIAAAILAFYAAALVYARDRIPAGLNNDAAEEALRGLYLVHGPHFEVMTFVIGSSAETLYLYLEGGMARLVGPTTLAVQLTSWLFALATILLLWRLVGRISESIPGWIPLLTGAGSLWLFHYARSGLRAISAPFFLAAFALLLERAEREPANRRAALACGAVLGLSIYAYTSTRVLPVAFLVYAAIRLAPSAANRRALLRTYITLAAGAFLVSIPNLVFLVRHPHDFLVRGNYVMRGTAADLAVNTLWSIFCPFYYPDRYRLIGSPAYYADGVSAGFGLGGFNPLSAIYAIALAAGLWELRRYWSKPIVQYLLCVWLVAMVALGPAGPSLTRLLVVLPVYLALAALGFAYALRFHPQARWAVLGLILWAGLSDQYRYLSGAGEAPDDYGGPATAIGQKAAALGRVGQKVLCIVSSDASVIRYLTYDDASRVRVVEFNERPFNPAEVPTDFGADALLIENVQQFGAYITQIPAVWRVGATEDFTEVRMR